MHIHILGICGTFMGGVAQLARALGYRVTGCDANVYPPMSTQLEKAGIELIEGFSPNQLSLNPDVWVVGNVVSRGNPLIEAILNAGLPYLSGPQWVGEKILQNRRVIAVAGTHGKTTVASMLAWVLEQAGLNPGFLIGGVPGGFDCSARLGQGDLFVIEADEYDTAFFDKRSKFVHYRPNVAILNNLEFDHADIFPDLAAIETQFHHLLRTVPSEGHVVCAANTASLVRVIDRGCWSPVSYFQANGTNCHWTANVDSTHQFDVLYQGQHCGQINWTLSGVHSINNALAVAAAATVVGVQAGQVCQALSCFPGVKRRMELVGEIESIRIYDDFAHHPTAITTTLEGACESLKQTSHTGRLLAVFEPRSNTMKQGFFSQTLPTAFDSAEHTWCYGGGVQWDVGKTFQPLGNKATVMHQVDDLVRSIVAFAQPGDWLVVMSNGAFGGIHKKLLHALSIKFSQIT